MGWYFCRSAVRCVIGKDGLRWVVMWSSFCAVLLLRISTGDDSGLVISEWLGPGPIWPLSLGGVERRLVIPYNVLRRTFVQIACLIGSFH